MANSIHDIDLDELQPNQELIAEMRARFDRAEAEKQRIYRQIEREQVRERRRANPIRRFMRRLGFA